MADQTQLFHVRVPMYSDIMVKAKTAAEALAIGEVVRSEIYDLVDGRSFIGMLEAAADDEFRPPEVPASVVDSTLDIVHEAPLTVQEDLTFKRAVPFDAPLSLE